MVKLKASQDNAVKPVLNHVCYVSLCESLHAVAGSLCFIENLECWSIVAFPQFGGTGAPMGVGLRGVRWSVSNFLLIVLQSP